MAVTKISSQVEESVWADLKATAAESHRSVSGLLTEAKFKWHMDLDRSFVISDKWQDAEAARQAGCTSLMIESPWIGSVHHDFLMPTFKAAVEKILQLRVADAVVA